jgi:hypothetical protein
VLCVRLDGGIVGNHSLIFLFIILGNISLFNLSVSNKTFTAWCGWNIAYERIKQYINNNNNLM